jgi:small conductance mechanosensitive channel
MINEFIKIWVIERGGRALLILISAQILIYIIRHLFNTKIIKFIADIKTKNKSEEEALEKRLKTIKSVIVNFAKTIIYTAALIMILSEFKVNVGPIIAGAGIVGLAIGFGSRKLVEDYIAGLFILIENQYAKGDVVEFLGLNIKGKVYGFNLRRTVILGDQGELIFVPNGQISRIINFSKKITNIKNENK